MRYGQKDDEKKGSKAMSAERQFMEWPANEHGALWSSYLIRQGDKVPTAKLKQPWPSKCQKMMGRYRPNKTLNKMNEKK